MRSLKIQRANHAASVNLDPAENIVGARHLCQTIVQGSRAKLLTLVAALANVKVGALVPKNAAIVVATRATLRSRIGIVLRRQNGTDLSGLRQSASLHTVTTIAS